MASQQQPRKQSTTGGQGQEEGGRHGAGGQQGQEAMNLEEIGKYRAEAQQHSVDLIRAAEERFNRANQQQKESHGCGGGHEVAGHHAGTEAKRWLADAASDARERCNRAMGMSPTASHGGTAKGPAAQSFAGATAASRAKETKKASSTEEAEKEGRGNVLTRQGEMGHGRQADKVSEAEAVRAAVEKHDKGKKVGGQQQSNKDTASHAVGAEAKDAGARGAAEKTEQATQQAAAKARDATVATGAQVAQKAKEVTAGAGSVKTTKDSTAEKTRDDVTGRRHEHEEPHRAGSAAGATGSVAQKTSDTAWRARDKAEHKAGEAKHRASSETGITDRGGTGRDKQEEESTTIVGDVLEAVSATVVGLAQHAKGIVAGEEELVPGDVVEAREAKVAGAKKEEKRKTA